MRFFKSFRLLHRRTKSEGDVVTVLAAKSAIQTTGGALPVQNFSHQGLLGMTLESGSPFVDVGSLNPSKGPLPIFDPIDLYAPFSYEPPPRLIESSADSRIIDLEAELAMQRRENRTLKADLVEITKETTDVRTALYTEMAKNAYLKRQAMVDAARVQTLNMAFTRYKAIDGLLARIGLHKAILEAALAAHEGGGNAEEVVMDAIKQARTKTGSDLSTMTIGPRTSEQYTAVLNMTLKARKELKRHKKLAKFWKRTAQQDGQHRDTITPSPSDISSIHEILSMERQKAVDELAARRREGLTNILEVSESFPSAEAAAILPVSQVVAVKGKNFDVFPASASDTSPTAHGDVFATLPPLASESMKRELARHSTSKRFSGSLPVIKASGLRQVDLNIPKPSTIPELAQIPERRPTVPASSLPHRRDSSSTSEIGSGRISKRGYRSDATSSSRFSSRSFGSILSASLRKSESSSSRIATANSKTGDQEAPASRRDGGESGHNAPFDNTAFRDAPPDDSGISDGLSSGSGSRFLEHIIPDSTPTKPFEHVSLGQISEESVTVHDHDMTFTAHATPTTGPTTPSKTPSSSPTKKSKLPVLKYLRRLSPLSSPTKTRDGTTPPKVAKKSRVRAQSFPTTTQRSAIPLSTRRPTVSGGQNHTVNHR
ncbi:hypothetical protein PILCRDRAFT_97 [Piloderma croceum F 1598]|uniref:Uncharacterized protein n=1 Tax=Piloderma croceum (strain F 1598) TaxID=765440 RepID=A0A0C3CQI7_PILCF|nr:hypothetical protein PILCRDRAFT_97 [Piloderma croceum F 1598]